MSKRSPFVTTPVATITPVDNKKDKAQSSPSFYGRLFSPPVTSPTRTALNSVPPPSTPIHGNVIASNKFPEFTTPVKSKEVSQKVPVLPTFSTPLKTSHTIPDSPRKEKSKSSLTFSSPSVLPCIVAFCAGLATTAILLFAYNGGVRLVNPPSFADILDSNNSEKFWKHHYEHYYDKWFLPYRLEKDVKVLEIGARKTGTLIKWLQYFENPPTLIQGLTPQQGGAEMMEQAKLLPQGVACAQGDITEQETLKTMRAAGPFDIIVDDGSHVPAHMISALFDLWGSVKPGGTYVIEDLQTSYWRDGERIAHNNIAVYGTGIGSSPQTSAVEKVKQFIDVLQRNQVGATGLSVMPGDDSICSITWGRNTVALYKCSEKERKAQPIFQQGTFDQGKMADWIRDAKSSNPDGYKF